MPTLTEQLLDAFGRDCAASRWAQAYGLDTFVGADAGRRRQVKLTQAVLRRAIGGIAESFGDDLPFLLLKGEPLQRLLFDGRYLRPTGDVDLLVLPGDIDEARRRLRELGYRRARDEAPRMWVHNQEPFRHDDHGVIVELHWSVAEPQMPQPAVGELFQSRVGFAFDNGLEVDVLRADWLFLQLVSHFHHHMGFAKGLVDIAGWLDRFAPAHDSAALLGAARELGMYGMVQWPLHTIARLTGDEPPMFDGGADLFVRALAAGSTTAMRGCLTRAPRHALEASLVAVMPRLGPVGGVALRSVTMLVADGGAAAKGRALLRPVLEGPHVVGRVMHGAGR